MGNTRDQPPKCREFFCLNKGVLGFPQRGLGTLTLGDLLGRDVDGDNFTCACRKSNPNILVVQPAQDRAAKNGPGQFDGARDRRILLQR